MILLPEIPTRINDQFIIDDTIDATPLECSVKSALIPGYPNDRQTKFQADFYKNFALDIVTETVFDYPYPYITEKTLRPIASKRMFIVVGPFGVLNLLRNKGFVTFGDFINEDYDLIKDPVERFKKILSVIDDFLLKPLDDIKQFYNNNQDRFEQNFLTLKQLRTVELQEICQKIDTQ